MKKDKKLIIIIVILCILLAGCVGYICFDKFILKDNEVVDHEKENDDIEEKEEDRELTVDELNALTAKVEVYNSAFSSYYPIDDISEIDNESFLTFALNRVRTTGDQQEFDANKMDDVINTYFGSDVKINHKDYLCSVEGSILYKYDETNKKYTFNTEGVHGHGGSISGYLPEINTKVLDGKYEDGFYYVNAKVLYSNSCGDTCGPVYAYYSSYSGGEAVATNVSEYITEADKEVYREKLPITTYKFKKYDNNLILVSVEIK